MKSKITKLSIDYLWTATWSYENLYNEIKKISQNEWISNIKSILWELTFQINKYYWMNNELEKNLRLLLINIFWEFIQIRLCNWYSNISRQISDNIKYIYNLWDLYSELKLNYSKKIQNKIENLFWLCFSLYWEIEMWKTLFEWIEQRMPAECWMSTKLNKLLYETTSSCWKLFTLMTKQFLQESDQTEQIQLLIWNIENIYSEFQKNNQLFIKSFDNWRATQQEIIKTLNNENSPTFEECIIKYINNEENNIWTFPQDIHIVIFITIVNMVWISIKFNEIYNNNFPLSEKLVEDFHKFSAFLKNKKILTNSNNTSLEKKYIVYKLNKIISKEYWIMRFVLNYPNDLNKALIETENYIVWDITPWSCERYWVKPIRELIRNAYKLQQLYDK